MDLNLIKKLIKIVDTSGITDLEIEEEGLRVKISKKVLYSPAAHFQPAQAQPAQIEATSQVHEADEKTTGKLDKVENLHEIRSPIVGTFYRAPGPDADNYVQVGDNISEGSVLCIVEAMKLMNEIESDISGKIIKILVENGKPVEYNQPLFLIQPS